MVSKADDIKLNDGAGVGECADAPLADEHGEAKRCANALQSEGDNASPADAGSRTHRDAEAGRSAKGCFAFALVAIAWVAFDRITKAYFDAAYTLGQVSPFELPLFHFRLVHNTGMAWGMFGDSTFALGVLSCVVCIAIACAFAFWRRLFGHAPNALETFGLSLVFAGGLGNAIDRFAQGYVVDFIEFTFVDFPVFNIADIGVTCGFVLVVLGYLWATREVGGSESEDGEVLS